MSLQSAARERARAVLAESGDPEAPIPVERIIRARGIKVQFSPLDQEISGMALVKDSVAIIGVNALHHPNRQRFTMAHELGHHVLHSEHLQGSAHVDKGFSVLMRDGVTSQGTDGLEIAANAFASELLIPEARLAAAVDLASFDIDDVERLQALARRFKVSPSAMQYRLLAFG